MPNMTLDQAWSIWSEAPIPEDEDLAAEREDAEMVILDQLPHTARHAIMMLDVLAENVEAGSRSDRRDIAALRHLKEFLGRPLLSHRV